MALNFPDSPTLNQEVELGGKTYRWDGVKWRMVYVVTPTAQSLAPTITKISEGDQTLTFTITNNDTESAVINYEASVAGDTTPDTNVIELAGGATSSNLTISGLTNGQSYFVHATASVVGKIKSDSSFITGTPAEPIVYTTATATTTTSRQFAGIEFFENVYLPIGAESTFYGTEPSFHNTSIISLPENTASVTFSSITGFAWINLYKEDGTTNGHYAYRTDIPGRIGTIQQTLTFPSGTRSFGVGVCSYQHPSYNMPNAISFSNFTNLTISYTLSGNVQTDTYEDNGTFYKYHVFKSSGTFTVSEVGNGNRNQVDYLIIGGGGGGGRDEGGGGGAGGYLTGTGTLSNGTYNVVIGAGGVGSNPANGGNTSFLGFTAIGGGSGGFHYSGGVLNNFGANGGSGGGGRGNGINSGGGVGTAGQGNNGGAGAGSGGGGGGGASAPGQAGSTTKAGDGGAGLSSSLTGTAVARAGGGGGGGDGRIPRTPGVGGLGGGGNGSSIDTSTSNTQGSYGVMNTGGGGGGGRNGQYFGFNGGSGVVIIRYEVGGL